MNSKNINKHLSAKVRDWLESIDDESVVKAIKENLIITGGALVSLLTGEPVHDYDCYFRTKDACAIVAGYYIRKWNEAHSGGRTAELRVEEDKTITSTIIDYSGNTDFAGNYPTKTVEQEVPGRVKVFIRSDGVAGETKEETESGRNIPISEHPFPPVDRTDEEAALEEDIKEGIEKPKYRPVFLSSNAITLSDKIQIVVRFYGEVEEIHKNYDFAHCTCSWSMWNNKVQLPTKALECIINKELYYVGSKYPLCSIIRTRKYLERGYHINAGQYVKMAFQLNDLNLYDLETLEEQLTGVDSGFFSVMIDALRSKYEKDGTQRVDQSYVFELINRMM